MKSRAPSGSRQGWRAQPPSDHSITVGGTVLKVLLSISVGVFIYANPEARQITADLLRATGDALAPAVKDRSLED